MKNLIKLVVLGVAASGLVACSSAPKEDDSVLADVAAEAQIEETDQSVNLIDTEGSFDDEDDISLGTGSSGLGH